MRKILICSGVLGRPKSLSWLRLCAQKRRPDAILFAGNILDMARHYTPESLARPSFAADEAHFIENFFEAVGSLGVFTAIIPGPLDTPLVDLLRLGMHAEIEYPHLHLAHATLIEKGEAAICGMGGPLGNGAAADRDASTRTMVEYHLRNLWTAKQPYKILMLAQPPTGDLGGEQGSTLAAELIDSLHPSLCVTAGPHERRGSQRIASTLVINPGHLAEGSAVWLDRKRPIDEQVELLDLRHLDQPAVATEVGYVD